MTAAYFYVFMCFCDIVHFSLSVFVYFFVFIIMYVCVFARL